MSARLEPDAIRAAALGHLGARDARARQVLSSARITTERDDASWEGSGGSVRGVRVVLGVDPRALGEVDAHPAIHDALCEALAAAVAGPGVAMTTLVVRWSRDHATVQHAYRGETTVDARGGDPSAEAIGPALAAFVEGAGASELAQALRVAAIDLRAGRRVIVTLPSASALERRRWTAVVEAAVRALLPTWSASVRFSG